MKQEDEPDCNFDASSKYSHREHTHDIFDCSSENDRHALRRLLQIRVPARLFESPKHSGATDKGVTPRLLYVRGPGACHGWRPTKDPRRKKKKKKKKGERKSLGKKKRTYFCCPIGLFKNPSLSIYIKRGR